MNFYIYKEGGKLMEYPQKLVRADVNVYFGSDKPLVKYKDVFLVRYDDGGFSVCSAKQIISMIKRYSDGQPDEVFILNRAERIMAKIEVCNVTDKNDKVDKIRHELRDQLRYYSSAFGYECAKIR